MRATSFICFVVMCFAYVPVPSSGAELEVGISLADGDRDYDVGDTIVVNLSAENLETEEYVVDFHVELIVPDGAHYVLSSTGWGTGTSPCLSSIAIPAREGYVSGKYDCSPLFSLDIPSSMPPVGRRGTYELVAFMTRAGTDERLAEAREDGEWPAFEIHRGVAVATIDNISPNPAVKGSDTVDFEGSADDGGGVILAHEWSSHSDDVISNEQDFSIAASELSTGTHTISYRVEYEVPGHGSLWSDPATETLAIRSRPASQIDSIAPNPATQGDHTVQFHGHGTDTDGSVVGFEWRSNLDSVLGTSEIIAIPANEMTAGEHTISFKVQDDHGLWSDPTTETLVIMSRPTAHIDSIAPNPATQDEHTTVQFDGHGEDVDGTVVSYEWYSDLDGPLSQEEDFWVAASELSGGKHTIIFYTQDDDGLVSAPATGTLVIKSRPTAHIDSVNPNPATRETDTVAFDGRGEDLDGAVVAYEWHSDLDGLLSEDEDFSIAASELSVGEHSISLYVQDDDGLVSAPATEALIIKSRPTAIIDSITPNPAKQGADTVQFSGHGADVDGSIAAFGWFSDRDGLLSQNEYFSIAASELSGGTHTITLFVQDDDGLLSAPASRTLAIKSRPNAYIDSIAPNPATQGIDTVQFDGHAEDVDGSVVAFGWFSDRDGLLSQDEDFSTAASQLSIGSHVITLIVQDNEGLLSLPVTGTLQINSRPTAYIDSIAPNPATQWIDTVQFEGHAEDADGSVVAFGWFSNRDSLLSQSEDFSIAASNLSAGNHLITLFVQDNDGLLSAPATRTLQIRARPTAYIDSITPNPATQEVDIVQFNSHADDADGSVVAFGWFSDHDGLLSQDEDFSIAARDLSDGTHTITLFVQDDDDLLSAPATQSLRINLRPIAHIESIKPNPATQGIDTVQFKGYGDDSDGQVVAYEWSSNLDGRLSEAEDFSVFASDLSIGRHTISYVVQDTDGACSAPDEAELEIKSQNAVPTAQIDSITPNPAIRYEDNVQFEGHGEDTDGLVVAYEWSSDLDGVLSQSEDFSTFASDLSAGTHTISYSVQDNEDDWSPPAIASLIVKDKEDALGIEVYTDKSTYTAGEDALVMSASASNGGVGVSADVHIAVIRPDGAILEVPDWNTDLTPFIENIHLPPEFSQPKIELGTYFVGSFPFNQAGEYFFAAAFTEPGTLNFISGVSYAPFTVGAVAGFLLNGDVSPDTGTTDTDFCYSVDFQSDSGDAPVTHVVFVDDTPHEISLASGMPSNGEYQYHTQLSAGLHSFHFEFIDVEDVTYRDPAAGEYFGPFVSQSLNTPPNAYIDSISPNPATQGADTVHFVGHGTDEDGIVVAYEWSSDLDGVLSTSDDYFTMDASQLTAGTHEVSYKVQDDDGAWSRLAKETLVIDVSGNTAPTAYIGTIAPNPATQGADTVQFSGTATDDDGQIVAHEWRSDRDGILSQNEDFGKAASEFSLGIHTISYRAQDDDGVWSAPDTDTLTIQGLNTPPNACISSISPNPATQEADTIEFDGYGTDADGSVVAYEWFSSQDGVLSDQEDFSKAASALSVGTHTISFKVKDNDGDWSSPDIDTLTVKKPNSPPTACIDSITPNPATQDVDTVQFSGHGSDADGDVVCYEWSSDRDGVLSIDEDFSEAASNLSVGTHVISYRVRDDGNVWSETDTDSLTIQGLNTPPNAYIDSISPNPATQGEDTVQFNGHAEDADGNVVACEWRSDINGLLSDKEDFSVSASALGVGTHSISYKVQDDDEAWSTPATDTLTIKSGEPVSDLYVDAEAGDNTNDGSEASPFETITYALSVADGSQSNPVTIHVAAGTYAASTNGETFPLNMKSWVSLSGEHRDTTILDAEAGDCHLIYCIEVDNLTIERLKMMGGRNSHSGAGIYCESSSPQISNNTLFDCWGHECPGLDYCGGGIQCLSGSPEISNNVFQNCWGMIGGAIYCEGGSPIIAANEFLDFCAADAHGGGVACVGGCPTIDGNHFEGCGSWEGGAIGLDSVSADALVRSNTITDSSAGSGGGVYCAESSPTIRQNTISDNEADLGGGIYCEWGCSPIILNNMIVRNSGKEVGGGIANFGESAAIIGNMITDNSASWGAGILSYPFEVTVSSNIVVGNVAEMEGGGIYISLGPAIDNETTIVSNNQVRGNTAYYAGGGMYIYASYSTITVDNNLVADNVADADESWGGGIYFEITPDYEGTISNNTIVNNAATAGAGIYNNEYLGSPTVVDCIIWGNGDDLKGVDCAYVSHSNIEDGDCEGASGNISEDPMFETGPDGDYYLDPDSPCIDTGSRTASAADLADRTTQADGSPDSGTVDMGYHYPIPTGERPTAYIDSISPNPAKQGEDTVQFSGHGDDSDGSLVGYEWRSDLDGVLSSDEDFSMAASALSVGVHTISYRVQDNESLWSDFDTDALVVEGNSIPTAYIDSISPNPAEQGEDTVQFRGHGTDSDGEIVAHVWESSRDGLLSTDEDFDLPASDLSVGEHSVAYMVQDNEGAWSNLIPGASVVELTIEGENSAPTADIDLISPNPARWGNTIQFNGHGSDSDGTVEAHEWSSDLDGVLSTDDDFYMEANDLSVGVHTISYKVQDDKGAWSTPDTAELTIEPANYPPTAHIDSISPNPAVQGEDLVVFQGHGTDNDGSVVGYEWSSSRDGVLSSDEDFSKAASGLSVGTHTISYRARDDEGEWSSPDTKTLTIEGESYPPTAYIDSISPNPAKQGEDTISFQGHGLDSDGSVVAYEWSSNLDGVLSTSEDFSEAASDLSAGTHTISYKVQDDDDNWSDPDTDTLVIEAENSPPTAHIDSIEPDPATQGEDTVDFQGHGSDSDGSVVAYEWRSDLDGVLSTDEDFSMAASDLSIGTHTISYKVQDDGGDWSAPDTETLVVEAGNSAPTAHIDSIEPNPAQKGKDTVVFQGHGTDSDGSVAAYEWSSSRDGMLSTDEDFSTAASYLSVGTHTISYRVQDDQGDWSAPDTDTLTIEGENSPPTACIDSIQPNPASQDGDTVQFMGHGADSDGSIVGYEWSSDLDGVLSTVEDFSIDASALSLGSHTISFKVKDNDGDWSDPDTDTLVINTGNSAPTAYIDSIQPSPAEQGKDTVQFMGHGTDSDGSVVAHVWSSDIDGYLSSNEDFSRAASDLSVGTHTISYKVQDDDGEWSNPDTETLVIEAENSQPTAHIDSIEPNPATQGEDTVVFQGHGTDSDGSAVAYEWSSDLDGYLSGTEDFSMAASDLSVGTHTISYCVQDDDGEWSDPDTDTLLIEAENSPPTAYIDSIEPNPATQGEDTIAFQGHGTDTDGSVVAYEWSSDLDGYLSGTEDFSMAASDLSVGTHTISYCVQDDDGDWSEPYTDTLVIQPASDLYVDGECGDDSNDGSQGSPFKTITQALSVADGSEANPVTIHVATGTYAASTNGETFPLNMKSWVSLSGESRDTTILDAERDACHVMSCYYVNDLTITGVTMKRSDGRDASGSDANGGGIYCYYSSPTISNNIITMNWADYGGGLYCAHSSPTISNNTIQSNVAYSDVYSAGAGIFCCQGGSPTIANNVINNNYTACATYGGGIYCNSSSPDITGNTISENRAFYGCGVYCEAGSPTIAGNTITDNEGGGDSRGGGIYCESSSPSITDNTISRNAPDRYGGGIYCLNSSPTIEDNDITYNDVDSYSFEGQGGGIYCDNSSPTISNNTIGGNSVSHDGAGVACHNGSSPTISGNTISNNTAGEDGGGIYCYESSPTISNNTISDNSATGDGGGIECYSSSPTISSNTITGNETTGSGSYGGGIDCCNSSPTIENNTITGNGVYYLGGGIGSHDGGSPAIQHNVIADNEAHAYGGGIGCQYDSTASISDNIIALNTGGGSGPGGAGGIMCWESACLIEHNTIVDNRAIGWDGGDGVFCYESSLTIIDCIIWGNGDDLDGVDCSDVSYCNIEDSDCEGQNGNISEDPIFVTGPYGDYYLDPDSPCVDAGSQSASAAGLEDRTTQVDGTPDSGTVDMGYHYQLPTGDPPTAYIDSIEPNPATQGEDTVVFQGHGTDSDGSVVAHEWSSDLDGHLSSDEDFSMAASDLSVGTHTISYKVQDDDSYWSNPDRDSLVIQAGAASDLYVDGQSGDDSSDGSQGSPFKTITHALSVADGSAGNPVTIHVAPATYAASTNGETFPLNMKSWVSLSGEDRDTTILDAEDAAYHVIYCYVVDNLTISGLTITGGEANGSDADRRGGGICCIENSSPTISDNRITDNRAGNCGGGICCIGSSPTISNNMISNNRCGGDGGAICCIENSAPTISNNTIESNIASDDCGGIVCGWESSPMISENMISDNTGYNWGGGIFCYYYSSPTISNNTITGNSSSDIGAGICCDYSSPTISNNTIAGNSAGTRGGGGIGCWYCSPTISNNTISDNSTDDDGGGVFCWESSPNIQDNAIAGNSAGEDGGGIYCTENSSPTFTNCTICENTGGGGIYCSNGGSATLTDCIIWGNGDDLDGADCSDVSYCDIEDGDCEGQNGNISEDPMFVTGPYGAYYFDPDSPCVDAGSQSAASAGLSDRTTQADGTPDCGTVDMGYHYEIP